MKKFLAILLAAVLCFAMIACGEDTPAKTDAPTKTDAPAQSTNAPTTDAPGTDAPGTDAPEATTEEVTTEPAPQTEAPTEATANVAIGTNYYYTLSDAFANVKNGETIKVLKDFTENITFENFDAMPCEADFTELDAAFTVDGQNHKITANVDLDAYIKVYDYKVTIINLAIDYEESTNSVANGKEGCAVVSCVSGTEGEVVLENCTFNAKWGDCLNVYGGKVTIKSGKYTIDPENGGQQSNLICTHGGTLVVEDGTFERMGTIINRAMIRCNGKTDNITINGGNWKGSIGRLFYLNSSGNAPDSEESPRTYTINGGVFEFGVDDPAGLAFEKVFNFNNGGNTLVITGGEFITKKGPGMFLFQKGNTAITIKGGTFTAGDGTFFTSSADLENATLVIEDGTFDALAATAVLDENAGKYISIKGGTFKTPADQAAAVKALFAEGSTAKVN